MASPEKRHTTRISRGYIQLRWIIIISMLALVLLAIGNSLLNFQHEAIILRQSLEVSETKQTLAILQMIRERANNENWSAIHADFLRMEKALANTQLKLIQPNGKILTHNNQPGTAAHVSEDGQVPPVTKVPRVEWLDSGLNAGSFPCCKLRVSSAVTNDRGQIIAILISESDHQPAFTRLFQENRQQISLFFLTILLIVVVTLLISWRLFIVPLRKNYAILNDIKSGEYQGFLPASPVQEVQQISTAFNEIIGYLAQQHEALEALNRQLEETVVKRSAAPEASNAAIGKRADQLEAMNTLIASTAAAMDMSTLVKDALVQAVRIMQTDVGVLRINGHAARIGLEKEAGSIVAGHHPSEDLGVQRLVVVDWEAVPEDDPLYPVGIAMKQINVQASLSVPIFTKGNISGQIGLGDRQPRNWTQEEIALLEIIAHHLGTAAERTQSVEDMRNHNDLMKELVAQSEQLNRTFTLDEVIVRIGEGALSLSHADRLAVFIKDAGGEPRCAWSHGLSAEFITTATNYARNSHWMMQRAANYNNPAPFLFSNLQNWQEIHFPWLISPADSFRSLSAWPLIYENHVTAFVGCFYNQPKEWQQNEQEILNTFFRLSATALENTRLLEAECAQRKLAEALRDVTATLASSLEPDEVLDGILSNLGRVIPHHTSMIILIEDDLLKPARWQGISDIDAEMVKSWVYPVHELRNRQAMIETVQAVVIPDTDQDPHWIRRTGLEWVRSYAGAPICQRGEVTGFIDVMSEQPGFFPLETGEILQAFANHAAIALENARQFSNTQQRMDETSMLYRAIQPLFHPVGDIESLVNQITDSVTREFSSAHCSILLLNENRTHLKLVAQSGSLQLSAPELPLDGRGLTVTAVRTGSSIYSPDVSHNPNYVSGSGESRSELAIPLYGGGQVIGVLNLESPEADAFDQRGQRLLASFAEQAALGLENARLYESTHQRARELEALHTATTSLVSTLDIDNLLDRILASVISAIPNTRAAALYLLDVAGQIHLRVQHGLNENELQSPEWDSKNRLWSWALQQRQPTLISRSLQVPPGAGGNGLPGKWDGTSLLLAPLILDDQVLGLIVLISPDSDAFAEQDLHLFVSFASTATAAIHNAQLHSAVQNLAITDPLTGVYNRRGFFNLARHMFEQAERYHHPISAIMIDIDFFKNVNDQFGHDAGDAVLQALTGRCRKALREADLICRYGGEEFTVLLPESDLVGAHAAASRLFNNITEAPIETAAGPVWVTVSVGVASSDEECSSLDKLLKRADQALYQAKGRGRNQVRAWEL